MDKRIILAVAAFCLVLIGIGIWSAGRIKPSPTANLNDTNFVMPKELEVGSMDHVVGPQNAQITIVEYGDFQCPSCKAYQPIVKRLLDEFKDSARLVYRNYPLTQIHQHAWGAAKAAEAANKQGKYWEMHELLYDKQDEWNKTKDELATFSDYAKSLNLNVETFKKDFASTEIEKKVHDDQLSGDALRITGTPTFFVNGRLIELPGSYDAFASLVRDFKQKITPTPISDQKVHEHADFVLFVDGRKMSLSFAMYNEKNPDIHIHDGFGEMIHKHKSAATLGTFYDSLSLKSKTPTLLYINGSKYDGDWKAYEFKDADKLALSNTELTATQLALVSDKACIYSEKCPERGKAPTENCVGGLGTDCKK